MRIEKVEETFDIDVGAPMPTILSNEHNLYLIFYIVQKGQFSVKKPKEILREKDDALVTVKFDKFAQFKFGNPNDEAIEGHPLYNLGLEPYSIQKVVESEWIKDLIKMNSVHPYHRNDQFDKFEHFIFYFHDTCFEIVADGYSIEQTYESNIKDEIRRISNLI